MTTAAHNSRAGRLGAGSVAGALATHWATALLWVGMGAHAAIFSWLSLARHRAFYTGRLDLGNMMQAAWSTGHGDLLSTTAIDGEQFSRLGVHVDPLLVLFAPLLRLWPRPEILLVSQVVAVSLGALAIFWLGRRWLGSDPLALAGAGAYLLYPPLQWAAITEFHPVTLAAPLLAFAIWAAETGRLGRLALFAGLALLAKEEVGLSIAVLGIWMAVRGRRRAGLWLAAVSLAWVIVAVGIVIPAFSAGGSELAGRYADLGDGPGEIVLALLLRPWKIIEALGLDWLLLVKLLAPLLLLPLAAPLLAAGALPDTLLNVLSSHGPQHGIVNHYASVPTPFLVASAVLGLAALRERVPWVRLRRTLRALPLALIPSGLVAGVLLGPVPWWSDLPLASKGRTYEYTVTAHADALRRAVAVVPDGAAVSASNHIGAHLSARRRIHMFPVVADAEWVVIDVGRRPFGLEVGPAEHTAGLIAFLSRPGFRLVFSENGALVYRRAGAAP
ncbi:MAG TPA: DUF2079 domain-containing protein [Methylomirabilota bacterium]|nr:DUF2079 domain-containing protein [Methylomirabilota bacterium]